MINGELIVDNFAGGGGEADTEHENSSRADRTAPVCIGERYGKKTFNTKRNHCAVQHDSERKPYGRTGTLDGNGNYVFLRDYAKRRI